MRITEPITAVTKGNRKMYVKRPCKEFAGIAAYRKAFMQEAEEGKAYAHPNLLKYLGAEEDEQGIYIALEYIPALPLNRAVVEESLHINTEVEAKRIMMQLLDAVEYLHAKGIAHLNIRPENILITRRAHDVKLINPASAYLHCQPSFFLIREKFSAPELFAEEDPQNLTACDIYSLGKVMEYVYSFCNLSAGASRIIRHATSEDPSKRYTSIAAMREAMKQSALVNLTANLLKGAAAVAVLGLIYTGLKDDSVSEENIHFAEEVELHRKELPPTDKAELTEHSLTYPLPATSDSILRTQSLPNEQDARAAEYQQTAERIFKKEFRKRAEKIIGNIYTPRNMAMDDTDFQRQSLDGFNQLDKIQRELAEQYKLDVILTTRLSSEVISELTSESMKKLEKK